MRGHMKETPGGKCGSGADRRGLSGNTTLEHDATLLRERYAVKDYFPNHPIAQIRLDAATNSEKRKPNTKPTAQNIAVVPTTRRANLRR